MIRDFGAPVAVWRRMIRSAANGLVDFRARDKSGTGVRSSMFSTAPGAGNATGAKLVSMTRLGKASNRKESAA
jgi:hypothetical protein